MVLLIQNIVSPLQIPPYVSSPSHVLVCENSRCSELNEFHYCILM